MINILLVEDHPVVREGLKRMLQAEPDMQVVAEANNGKAAIEQMKRFTPDVVLMDISMPDGNGIQATKEIKTLWPGTKILILTMHDDYLQEALTAGATGYMSKDLKRDELVKAIHSVNEGRSPISVTVTEDQLKSVSNPSEMHLLSERERAVLKLISEGALDRDVAIKLSISESTVKRALQNVFSTLKVRTRTEAVAEAMKRRLI